MHLLHIFAFVKKQFTASKMSFKTEQKRVKSKRDTDPRILHFCSRRDAINQGKAVYIIHRQGGTVITIHTYKGTRTKHKHGGYITPC